MYLSDIENTTVLFRENYNLSFRAKMNSFLQDHRAPFTSAHHSGEIMAKKTKGYSSLKKYPLFKNNTTIYVSTTNRNYQSALFYNNCSLLAACYGTTVVSVEWFSHIKIIIINF